jgi:hypothetical protein
MRGHDHYFETMVRWLVGIGKPSPSDVLDVLVKTVLALIIDPVVEALFSVMVPEESQAVEDRRRRHGATISINATQRFPRSAVKANRNLESAISILHDSYPAGCHICSISSGGRSESFAIARKVQYVVMVCGKSVVGE